MELVIIALIAVEVVIVRALFRTFHILHPSHTPRVSGSDKGWPRALANGFRLFS